MKSEHQIQQEILLEFGCRDDLKIWRQNTGKLSSGCRFISFGVLGGGDISGIIKGGIRLEIEVKNEKGKQRPSQKLFQKMIEEMGGVYILSRSVDDVKEALKKFINI